MFPSGAIDVGSFSGSAPALPELPASQRAEIVDRYMTLPQWGSRHFESAETNRLNESQWAYAKDAPVNDWLAEQLHTVRARSTYESRQNPTLAGVGNTFCEDVVGDDGPILEIQSDDDAYNEAGEETWREWFRAPTFRPNVSGVQLLKLWVRNLLRCGEFLATIGTDDRAEGPVAMRLRPRHPRNLGSPYSVSTPRLKMGIEFDALDRPTRYWIGETRDYQTTYDPYSPDDVIHEFVLDEEEQLRGIPWLNPSLQPAADLRAYDRDVLIASRRAARNNGAMFTTHPDAPVWKAPTSVRIEPDVIDTLPPGWQLSHAPATQPAAQYPDFRAEKHRDSGRPFGMPLLAVRLDASKHNYSSARMDTQGYDRQISSVQCFISGTDKSVGTLSRLVDLVLAEARFRVAALRRRPKKVVYLWTWPQRPHVDPAKEADGEAVGLESQTLDLIAALAKRGVTLDQHLRTLERVRKAYEKYKLPMPAWMNGGPPEQNTPAAREARAAKRERQEREEANYA
jgi:capsid protein